MLMRIITSQVKWKTVSKGDPITYNAKNNGMVVVSSANKSDKGKSAMFTVNLIKI